MKIFLTGASGFVGSYIHNLLIERGHTVIANDLFVGNNKDAHWVIGDISTLDLDRLPDVDAICHVGADISMGNSLLDMRRCLTANSLGTLRLVEWAVVRGLRSFVFTSSAGMYPRPDKNVVRNENHRIDLSNAYLTSKWQGELCLKASEVRNALSCCILRLGSPYGFGMGARSVLPTFVQNVCHGKELLIYGTGHRSQDFICVTDVANAHVAALEKLVDPGLNLFNLGSGFETSLNKLADSVRSVFRNVSCVHVPVVDEVDDRFVLDISRLREYLGVEPMDVRTGLEMHAEGMIEEFSKC